MHLLLAIYLRWLFFYKDDQDDPDDLVTIESSGASTWQADNLTAYQEATHDAHTAALAVCKFRGGDHLFEIDYHDEIDETDSLLSDKQLYKVKVQATATCAFDPDSDFD